MDPVQELFCILVCIIPQCPVCLCVHLQRRKAEVNHVVVHMDLQEFCSFCCREVNMSEHRAKVPLWLTLSGKSAPQGTGRPVRNC